MSVDHPKCHWHPCLLWGLFDLLFYLYFICFRYLQFSIPTTSDNINKCFVMSCLRISLKTDVFSFPSNWSPSVLSLVLCPLSCQLGIPYRHTITRYCTVTSPMSHYRYSSPAVQPTSLCLPSSIKPIYATNYVYTEICLFRHNFFVCFEYMYMYVGRNHLL